MDNADVQEMLFLAIQAKESGFPRIQADPEDIIEVFEQRNELLEILSALKSATVLSSISNFHREKMAPLFDAAQSTATSADSNFINPEYIFPGQDASVAQKIASISYALADAMLEARKK